MLCPKCGVDVGNEILLCIECIDDISAHEVVEPEPEPEPEVGEEELDESELDAEQEPDEEIEKDLPQSDHKSSKVAPSANSKKLILLALLGIGILVVALLLFTGSSDDGGVPIDNGGDTGTETVEGAEPGTDGTEEVEPVVEPVEGPKIPTAPTITSGTVSAAGKSIAAKDSISLYFPVEERLEIAFFSKELTDEQKLSVFDLSSLNDLEGIQPAFISTFWLRRGTSFCGSAAVNRYTVKVNAEAGTIDRPAEFDFRAQRGGIAELTCRLEQGAPLTAEFSQSTFDRERDKSFEYRWELRSSGPVYISRRPSKFTFTSNEQKPVAIWNKENRELQIGFFEDRVTGLEREAMRKAKSLLAVENKKPRMHVSFEVNEKYNSFEKNALRSYGVHFHRDAVNDGKGLTFPGDKDEASFYFVVTTKETEQLARLVGHLYEGDVIQGSMRDTQDKEFDEGTLTFSWELVFGAHVIDVFSEAMASIEELKNGTEEERSVPEGIQATIEAGKAKVKLNDAVALWYGDEYDLVIGFYQDQLSEAERARVIKNASVWNAVNTKKPNLVLIFDLSHGATELKKEHIVSFSISFVRDKLGEFFFPGSLNRATIKRLNAQIKAGDLSFLEGDLLGTDANIAIRSKGDHTSKKNKLYYTWDISAKVPVVAVP